LDAYQKQTAPLIRYYEQINRLRPIQGTGEQDKIFERVARVLEGASQ
jgi:adenylate kinase family enzyme